MFAISLCVLGAGGWWGHVQVLADDAMEGRKTGSPGYRRAADYVREQLQGMGVQPGAGDGYFQEVDFESRSVDESTSGLQLIRGKEVSPLKLGDDAFFNPRAAQLPEVEADLVFAGYGLSVPEAGYDDLRGLDLRGKVAVYVTGAPEGVPSNLAAFHQFGDERWRALRNAGAIGAIGILNPATIDQPWARIALNRVNAAIVLDDPAIDVSSTQPFSVTWNPERAPLLFAGSGHGWEEIRGAMAKKVPLPRFPLPARIRSHARVVAEKIHSPNVLGLIRGRGPHAGEYIVLSAHLDHLGIGQPIAGDRIYNGAIDNASGVATMLEVARALAADVSLDRSVLIAFVCGEEFGELGSRYLVSHLPVPSRAIAADLNVDMFKPIVPFKLLTVYGLKESDVGDAVLEAGKALGVAVEDDPEPLRNRFIRSDQFSFVRAGIPAVAMQIGTVPGTPQAEVMKQWHRDRYHAPSDDLKQPIDQEAASAFTELATRVARSLANRPAAPEWKATSPFKKFARP